MSASFTENYWLELPAEIQCQILDFRVKQEHKEKLNNVLIELKKSVPVCDSHYKGSITRWFYSGRLKRDDELRPGGKWMEVWCRNVRKKNTLEIDKKRRSHARNEVRLKIYQGRTEWSLDR